MEELSAKLKSDKATRATADATSTTRCLDQGKDKDDSRGGEF